MSAFCCPIQLMALSVMSCDQVIALFGRLLDLDGRGAFIERWIPLVRFTADKSVEVFESASSGRPRIKRTGRDWSPKPALHGTCRIAPSHIH